MKLDSTKFGIKLTSIKCTDFEYYLQERMGITMKKWIVIILVILAVLICGILLFNTNVEVEYVPETEIGEVDLRKTMITLYFQNAENKELQKESRLIDSKDLLLDPYNELINMLIAGPQSNFLQKTIPEGTKLLSVELVGNCLQVNLSKEFIENASDDENDRKNCVYSIVNTVTELNEVSSIKILINGEETKGFENIGLDFSEEMQKVK